MTLFIPLVCEDVHDMTQEEYLEILTGVFTEYVYETMSEDRFYFRFGEGVILDTLFEEWMELDSPMKLFTGSSETVNSFISRYDRATLYPVQSPHGKFGFTPGVVNDEGLEKYQEYFDEVNVFPRKKSRGLGKIATPCFSVTIPGEALQVQGEDVAETVREFVSTIQEATGVIAPEQFHAWMEADHPLSLFVAKDAEDMVFSDAQNLHPSPDGRIAIYFIDNPEANEEGESDEVR